MEIREVSGSGSNISNDGKRKRSNSLGIKKKRRQEIYTVKK